MEGEKWARAEPCGEDGFALYLNGSEILRRNAPDGAHTNLSAASGPRSNADAAQPENVDLKPHTGLLVSGPNVLAIHALNAAPNDPDFLLQPELAQIAITNGALQYFVSPVAASRFSSPRTLDSTTN